jgi:hypothetical protein
LREIIRFAISQKPQCDVAGLTGMNPIRESNMEENENQSGKYTWGPKLFGIVFVGMLVFFWWLVLYSHGVTVHEG